MTYQALYRRWRPQTFAELVGQEHITRTLQNALEQGRVSHAYLFCGPRGTGKTSAAKILAKAVNCEHGSLREPCNECPSCLGIQSGRVMDVLEIDAASNRGIDEIRDLREKVRYVPTEVQRKVYIIDEVHMLTAEAFNALLKTLEEPPLHVIFILATTEPHKLPATIVSRCQRLDFRLIRLEDIVGRLRDVAEKSDKMVTDEALQLIAEDAAGSLRDALSLLEQILAFTEGDVVEREVVFTLLGTVGREVFYDFTDAFLRKDLAAVLYFFNQVVLSGKDLFHFTQQAIAYYRDLMVTLACEGDITFLGIAPEWKERLKEQSVALGMGTIGYILSVLHELLGEIRWSARPRLLWELAIFKISGVGAAAEDRDLVQRVAALEARLNILGPTGSRPGVTIGGKPPDEPARVDAAKGSGLSADLSQVWPKVLDKVKEESIRAHAVLLDGQPVSWDGEVLELVFTSDFHREMMEEEGNKQCLEKVTGKLLGHIPVIRCTTGNSTETAATATAPKPGDLVEIAVDIFQGQIVDEPNSP